MKRLLHLLPMLGAALLLAACETVVDVEAPPHTPQLVAQGFFTADSLWAVRVTHSVSYASAEAPGFVDDAVVEIWDGDRLMARPTLADTGTYVATGRGARFGEQYTLRVEAPGYPAVEGTDVLPPPPRIARYQETPVDLVGGPARRQVTHVEITLADPPGVSNYYGLLVFQGRLREDRRTGQVQPLPPSLFPFESDDAALGESEFDFLDTDKTLYREAFFSDGLFEGQTYTLDFDVQYDAPNPDADVIIRRGFAVVLLAVSENFYRYWKTAGRQVFTNENPFAEPLRVHSNLSGGFGVFAGFQYRIFPMGTGTPGLGFSSPCSLLAGRLPICGPPPVTP